MSKLLLLLLLFALLSVACSRSDVTRGEWSPTSNPPPRFAPALPPLLIQGLDTRPYPPQNVLAAVDLVAKTTETETVSGTSDLAASLAAEYRVVKNVLLDQQNQIYVIHSDQVAANGLWLTQQREGALVLRRVDDAGMLTLSASGRAPVWSPDSQWLVYQDDAGLWLLSLVDLSQRPLSSTPLEPLAWSPDGRSLLLRDDKNLILMEIASQQQQPINGVEADQIHGQPLWSADGQEIYARYGENGRTTTDTPISRLVAIKLDGSRLPMRDLLPVSGNRGVTNLIDLSPDGQALLVNHIHECGYRAQDLFLWPARYCTGAFLLVETATGHYETADLPGLNQSAISWERRLPAVSLADLPLPPESPPLFSEAAVAPPAPIIIPPPLPTATPMPTLPPVAAYGETAANDKWAVTLLETIRGDAAWALIEPASPVNQPPPPEQEYLLLRVRLQYLGSEAESPAVWRTSFLLVDAQGQTLERVTQIPPNPAFELYVSLAPQATHEGWIVLMAPRDVTDLTVLFRPDSSRYSELELALP